MKVKDALYGFQQQDLQFLLSHPKCINGNQMGLGKTVEALALAQELNLRHVLVVCSKTMVAEWWYQINDWLDEPCLTPHDSGNKLIGLDLGGPKFVALNYDLLINIDYYEHIKSVPWDLIVFDECHKLKNPKAKRTKAAFMLSYSIPRISLMSGTPQQNGPHDLWSLFHIIDPQRYRSYSRWRDEFCETVLMKVGRRYFKQIVGAKNQDLLRQLLSLHMVRNEHKDVMPDLPPKRFRTVPVELGVERKQYNQMEKELFALLDSGELITAPAVIAQITRLRQICLDPNLLSHESPKPSTPSNKTQTVLDITEDTDGKIVIFSWFEQYTRLLASELEKAKIPYVTITGQVSKSSERGQANAAFQNDPSVKVMLGTIGAMGEGITLTAAHTCLFTDLAWNPSTNEQAESRLYGRLNDAHGILVINLHCEGTIEDHVLKVVRRKEKWFNEIVSTRRIVDSMRKPQ